MGSHGDYKRPELVTEMALDTKKVEMLLFGSCCAPPLKKGKWPPVWPGAGSADSSVKFAEDASVNGCRARSDLGPNGQRHLL